MTTSFLTVLGSAETVRWVLSGEHMAFSEYTGRRIASRMSHGDRLLFYASSKCWSGFSRVRPGPGMVISEATVLTDVRPLARKVSIGGRGFLYGCELLFEQLAPIGTGVPLDSLAGRLQFLAGRSNYGQALQRTPIQLSNVDAGALRDALERVAIPFEDAVGGYISGEHRE